MKREGIEKEVNGHTSKIVVVYYYLELVIETDFGAMSLQVMVTKTQVWSLTS